MSDNHKALLLKKLRLRGFLRFGLLVSDMGHGTSIHPKSGASRAQSYPMARDAATPSFVERLITRIRRDGPIPFSEFMAAALYDGTDGYYSRPQRKVGRSGDFFTSVSVGPLFGSLLARRLLRHWREIGRPPAWRIVECGAHDGTLANDVLCTLAELDDTSLTGLEYCTIEPSEFLRARQHETLSGFRDVVHIMSEPDHPVAPLPGLVFGNEVLDALPCDAVEWRNRQWWLRCVDCHDAMKFDWTLKRMENVELMAALEKLGGGFPEGYRTEIRTNYGSFLQPLLSMLREPLMLWIDYGFARDDYYSPLRNEGTLRAYARHAASDDVLEDPGGSDLTAHVDFTTLAEHAHALGGKVIEFRNQGAWLTELARDWLLSKENQPQPADLRAFQTLIHPAQLGAKFHVIELSWDRKPSAADAARIFRHLGMNPYETTDPRVC